MIAAPTQKTLLTPSGFAVAQDDSPFGTFGRLVTTSREYLLLQARTIRPTASVTISGLSRSSTDEDAVDETNEHADTESGEDRDGELVVRARSDPGDQVSRGGHHPGCRQVDAPLNDDEHLAERRDREDGRDREDVRERGVPQGVWRCDRSDDEERPGGQPHRQEACGDRGC